MFIHIQRGATTITHSEDYRCTTTHDITTGEDLSAARLHIIVHSDGVLAAQLQTLNTLRHERVGRYTDGYDHLIHIQRYSLALHGYRTTTARSIGLTQLHHLQNGLLHGTRFVGDVLNGIMQRQEVDTFLLGMLHLLQSGRHLHLRTTINQSYLSTQTLGCTTRVHSRITTTHYEHALSRIQRRISRRISSIHQVYARQILVR